MNVRFAVLICALLGPTAGLAQDPVPEDAVQAVTGMFRPAPSEEPLACAVHPKSPKLTYRLVYRAGYVIETPLAQLGPDRTLKLALRITPDHPAGPPLLLRDSGKIPPPLDTTKDASKFEIEVKGGFYLGTGKYEAELVLTGGHQQVCRRHWSFEVKTHGHEAHGLAPGHILALRQLEWPKTGSAPGSLTVFLHADSAERNAALLDALATVVERLPFSRVRVVAFSLDQRKELLQHSIVDAQSFHPITKALSDYSPAIVSYSVLQDPAGHREFLWKLLATENLHPEPARLVVFLGYSTLDDSHVPIPPACKDNSRRTSYVYFDFVRPFSPREPPRGIPPLQARIVSGNVLLIPDAWGDELHGRRAQREMPDVISRVTHACSGRTFHIYSPDDLATALEKTAELLQER